MSQPQDTLELVQGDASSIEVPVTDDASASVDLSGFTGAELIVRDEPGGAPLFTWSGSVAGSVATITPTQAQADAIVPGKFIGRIHLVGGTAQRVSERFYVRVEAL